MMIKKAVAIFLFVLVLVISFFNFTKVVLATDEASDSADRAIVSIHVFASRTCPHCQAEKEFLSKLVLENLGLKVYIYEVEEPVNAQLFTLVANAANTRAGSVPLTFVANQFVPGYADEPTTGQVIKEMIVQARATQAPDPVSELIKQSGLVPKVIRLDQQVQENNERSVDTDSEVDSQLDFRAQQLGQEKLSVPLLGEVDLRELSLPVLTILVGFLDGFNPCAMWTLMFLISLLLGMKSRVRMWLLGSTFIFASGLVYFLFMTAWLNFFLFVGLITWVRVVIGLVALVAGSYYLKDYWENKDGACKVEAGGNKNRVFNQLKQIAHEPSLWLALIGVVLLAFAVNLVELICSAGLPAVYTKVLSMSQLPVWQYYLYIFIYIIIFMLDDMVVFAIAMITLNRVGLNTKYARYSHLVGGILMLLIGLTMLFKPEFLMFG